MIAGILAKERPGLPAIMKTPPLSARTTARSVR